MSNHNVLFEVGTFNDDDEYQLYIQLGHQTFYFSFCRNDSWLTRKVESSSVQLSKVEVASDRPLTPRLIPLFDPISDNPPPTESDT